MTGAARIEAVERDHKSFVALQRVAIGRPHRNDSALVTGSRSFDFESQDGGADWNNILRDVADLGEKRRLIVDRLVACGLNRAALESLKEGSDDPKIVLAFV